MHPNIVLTPVQQRACDGLSEGIAVGGVLVLRGESGRGKTTILRKLVAAKGGVLLGAREFVDSLLARHADAIEESFLRMVEDAMAAHDLVMVDDLHLITNVTNNYKYGRAHLLDAALTALMGEAWALGKTLVFGVCEDIPWPIERRAYAWTIEEFEPEDYECICRAHLPAWRSTSPAFTASPRHSTAINSKTPAHGSAAAQFRPPKHSSNTCASTT